MAGEPPTVKLALWRADAIVLVAWLMSTDVNTVPDIPGVTQQQIDAAQAEVARDLGW